MQCRKMQRRWWRDQERLAEEVLSVFSEVAGEFTIYLCLSQPHMPAEPTGCVNERLGWGVRKPVAVGLWWTEEDVLSKATQLPATGCHVRLSAQCCQSSQKPGCCPYKTFQFLKHWEGQTKTSSSLFSLWAANLGPLPSTARYFCTSMSHWFQWGVVLPHPASCPVFLGLDVSPSFLKTLPTTISPH